MIETESQAKTCRYCKKNLRGRADKKFCDDSCRTMYHNQGYTQPLHVREINYILMRNRKIILELLGNNKMIRYSRESLLHYGFTPWHFTEARARPGGSIIHYCYETGFMEIGNNSFLLFTSDQWMG